jgi:hypothetical protein
VTSFERIHRHIQHRHVIGHEKGVEFRAFQFLDRFLDMREIKIHIRPRSGISPSAGMNAGRPHEGAEMKLAAGRHQAFLSMIGEFR